jgi:hypothetical protein
MRACARLSGRRENGRFTRRHEGVGLAAKPPCVGKGEAGRDVLRRARLRRRFVSASVLSIPNAANGAELIAMT